MGCCPIFKCLSLRDHYSNKKWLETVAVDPNLHTRERSTELPVCFIQVNWLLMTKNIVLDILEMVKNYGWHTDDTRGHRVYVFSRFSTATYSPWDSLNMFFFLSIIFIAPLGCNSPMSPAIFSISCPRKLFLLTNIL